MTKITNEQINEIAESMPSGLEGFMKGWGWQQFARKLLSLQEQTILDLQVELAKSEKSRKKWRDRALSAEADAREAIADFGELNNEMRQLREPNEISSIADFSMKVLIDQEQVNQILAKISEAMQKAASDAVESLSKMSIGGDFVKVESGEEKPEQAAKTLTHNGKTYPIGVWIEWRGGKESPIPDGVDFVFRFRHLGESSKHNDASNFEWLHRGDFDGDIIAFMIL